MPHVDALLFRKNFPILQDIVYLSSCSLGARSRQLDHSMTDMLEAMSYGAGAWHVFEEQVALARAKFAQLIGARSDQIAVMPNASVGAYQIAPCINWSDRPGILTSMAEFPSIAHIWLAQKVRGAQVTYATDVDEAAYIDRLAADIGLVSVPLVSYSDGRRLDVRAISQAAHARGIQVFVDAYQALGTQPVDVDTLGCDYLVAGASKYMLGLPGVAFVYERAHREDAGTPQLTGWFGRKNPFEFDPCRLDFACDARRYETGTPSVPALYAANAGLDLLLCLDMRQVRQHISGLVSHVVSRLTEAGIDSSIPKNIIQRGAHVALHDPQIKVLEAYLTDAKISISPRGDLARLAFHYYNTVEDADAVCDRIIAFQAQRRRATTCMKGNKPCDGSTGNTSPDACARALLAKWREDSKPVGFPYPDVMTAYHENGKEFVSKALLDELNAIRKDLSTQSIGDREQALLARFLDVALDKFDGIYEYSSYCALPLWPLPTHAGAMPDPDSIDPQRDRQLLALIADILRFELDAHNGRTTLMPDLRPDDRRYEKRLRLALNAARFGIARLGLPVNSAVDDIEAEAEKFCELLGQILPADEVKALTLTMQPVYVVHDEYMFLRVLQSFETNFAWMAIRLQSALATFESDPARVPSLIEDANRMYQEAAKLFPLLATMQREAFHTFRNYTEGASAIQSRNYKLVESLCRAPDPSRLESLAYHSVPEIHARVLSGQPNLDAALTAARLAKRLTPDTDDAICAAMEAFGVTLQKWRQTHYRLAVKMLGETTSGTGNTEGTPYLSSVRAIAVFKSEPQGELT